MTRFRTLAVSLALSCAAAACAAPRSVNVPIGRAQDLGVRVEREGPRGVLVLDAPACVAFLAVGVPYDWEVEWRRTDYGALLGPFSAVYPLYPEVPRCLEAGRHTFPLHRSLVTRIPPPTCLRDHVPALEGCHPPGYENRAASSPDPTDPMREGGARIILVSDLPIDPYAVAYAMSEAVLDSPPLQEQLATALLQSRFTATAQLVQALVADVPGSPLWSGIVRMRDPG